MGWANRVHLPVIIYMRLPTPSWCYALNLLLELPACSSCYALNLFFELAARSWCYALNLFLELPTRSWCYALNLLWELPTRSWPVYFRHSFNRFLTWRYTWSTRKSILKLFEHHQSFDLGPSPTKFRCFFLSVPNMSGISHNFQIVPKHGSTGRLYPMAS